MLPKLHSESAIKVHHSSAENTNDFSAYDPAFMLHRFKTARVKENILNAMLDNESEFSWHVHSVHEVATAAKRW